MDYTQELARFAAELTAEDIPVSVLRRTEDLFLDWTASALAGKGASGGPESIAIIDHSTLGSGTSHTFSELQEAANRLSNLLVAQGVRRGDRVAIVLPQRFETSVAYMAVLQMGAVAMPLSILFGPEALEFRLQDSEAVLAICDEASIGAVQGVRARCPGSSAPTCR